MEKGMYSISEKIKMLRERANLTQVELSKKLGLTRASINAWELGISAPSTRYIYELSIFFNVSTDYLFGIDETSNVNIKGLNEKEVGIVVELINYFKKQK